MQRNLFGDEKIDRSIRRLQDNQPKGEPYYGATSGGKDSIVIMKLADMAEVDVEWHYNVTTVDPPELVRFLRHNYPDVIFNRPEFTMWRLIKTNGPPTRINRFCCEYLKENHGIGAYKITGIRRAESYKRANRMPVEECLKFNGGIFINPIIDWSNADVWEFIREQNLNYCSLYDDGFKRLGCIGCPNSGKNQQLRQFKRWPHFKNLYIKAFDKMCEYRRERDLKENWKSGQECFDWWINNPGRKNDKQIGLFD